MQVTPFTLERFFAQTEFNVRYHLAASAIQSWTLRELLNVANDPDLQFSLFSTKLSYTEAEGIPELRREIARLYHGSAQAENILVTIGAIEANYLLLSTLLDPGDSFVVQTPYYQQLPQVGLDLGAKALYWHYSEEAGFSLDELANLLEQQPKLVMLNSPHNPTGYTFAHAAMEQIARMCRERNILLLSDEVYRELGDGDLPSIRDFDQEAVAIGSMSKAYGLAGLRVGWLAAPEAIVERCSWKRDYTSLCPPALGQSLALTALKHRSVIGERNNRLRQKNLAVLAQAIEGIPALSWRQPQAGVVAWVTYTPEIPSEQVGWELFKQGVLVAPGLFFGSDGYFRLGFGGSTHELECGLVILRDYFDALPRKASKVRLG